MQTEEYDRLIVLLKLLRYEANHTQGGLAGLLDYDATFVSKIELGTRRFDLVEFLFYCKALKLDPETTFMRYREFLKEDAKVVDSIRKRLDGTRPKRKKK